MRTWRDILRPTLPALLVSSLYAVVAAVLLMPGTTRRDISLVHTTWGQPEQRDTVPLQLDGGAADHLTHRLTVQIAGVNALLGAESISLLFATNGATSELLDAELGLIGTDCRFATRPGAALSDNALLTFYLTAPCTPAALTDPTAVEVTVHSRGAPALVIWAKRTHAVPAPVALFQPATGGAPLYLEGRLTPPMPAPLSRISLLAEMWSFAGTWPLWAVLALSYALTFLGAWRLVVSLRGCPGRSKSAVHLLNAVAAAAVVAGVTFAYVILAPPFQAPDEADHFLAMTTLVGSEALKADALTLAQRGHFERLKFRPEESFTAADVGHPLPLPWAKHVRAPINDRYQVVKLIWRLAAPWLAEIGAAGSMLAIRLFNGVFVALSLGLAAWLLQTGGKPRTAYALLVPTFLLAPSLPFFAMHVSNYPVFISAMVLQTAALIGGLHRPTATVAVMLGVGLGLSAASSRSGFLAAAFWAGMLACWGSLHLRPQLASLRRGGAFLALAAVSAVAVGLATGGVPKWTVVSELLDKAHLSPLLLAAGAGCALVLGAPALAAAGNAVRRDGDRQARVTTCLAVFLVLLLLWTALAPTPHIPDIEHGDKIVVWRYIRKNVAAFLSDGLGFGGLEFYVSRSFWGGFGWLDAYPVDALLYLVKIIPAAAIGLTLWRLRRRRQLGSLPLVQLAGGLGAVLLYVAALGYASWQVSFNLHGRYLIGAYLLAIALCLGTTASVLAPVSRRRWLLRLLTLQALVHAIAMVGLLLRYL